MNRYLVTIYGPDLEDEGVNMYFKTKKAALASLPKGSLARRFVREAAPGGSSLTLKTKAGRTDIFVF